jgi:hypothetical protein
VPTKPSALTEGFCILRISLFCRRIQIRREGKSLAIEMEIVRSVTYRPAQ